MPALAFCATLDTMHLGTRRFAGIPVTAGIPHDVTQWLLTRAQLGVACDVHLLESNGVATAERDEYLFELLCGACLVVPDGRWLEIFTRKSLAPLHQFRGEDLFRSLCDLGRNHRIRHFFVGSTEEKLFSLTTELESLYPGIEIVGSYCPPFRELNTGERESLSTMIFAAQPHIVWLGISTPRQDYEAKRIATENTVMTVAVGAAFEFVSGDKKRAPAWMSRLGMEWLFRLLSEPRRLAKRYLVGNIIFLWRVLRHWRSDNEAIRPHRGS
jgi:N-acetylglucosaminyldiphosphoundecaprenol N-acetyl-beta-D-mannosaminyltransferase